MKISNYPGSDARKKRMSCQMKFLHKFDGFDGNQDGKYQACSYVKIRISKSRWNFVNGFIWNIGLSEIQWRGKNRPTSYWEISPSQKLPIATLIEKIICVFKSEIWGWDWNWRKIKGKFSIGFFRTLKTLTKETEKIKHLQSKSLPIESFRFWPRWKV